MGCEVSSVVDHPVSRMSKTIFHVDKMIPFMGSEHHGACFNQFPC